MSKKIVQPKHSKTFTGTEKMFFGVSLLFLVLHVATPMLSPDFIFWGSNVTKYLLSWSIVIPIAGIIMLSIAFFFPPKDNLKLLSATQLCAIRNLRRDRTFGDRRGEYRCIRFG